MEDLAEDLDIPVRITRELLDILRVAGYLVATAGEIPAYQPARDIEFISVHEVLRTLKNFGGAYKITRITEAEKVLTDILAKADASVEAALSGMTLKDLISRTAPPQSGSGGHPE